MYNPVALQIICVYRNYVKSVRNHAENKHRGKCTFQSSIAFYENFTCTVKHFVCFVGKCYLIYACAVHKITQHYMKINPLIKCNA